MFMYGNKDQKKTNDNCIKMVGINSNNNNTADVFGCRLLYTI